jgi:hypothetical protein
MSWWFIADELLPSRVFQNATQPTGVLANAAPFRLQ